MTAVPPALSTAATTRRSSAATITGPTSDSIARRQTWTIIGSPEISASGLPGRRVEAMRAGIKTIGLAMSGKEAVLKGGLIRVAKPRAKRLINA